MIISRGYVSWCSVAELFPTLLTAFGLGISGGLSRFELRLLQ